MNHLKKTLKVFVCGICVVLIVCLGGCWNSRELDKLAIVRGIGIDASEKEPGKVQITAQIAKPAESGLSMSGSGKSESNGELSWNVTSTGDTVFGAIREMTSRSSRKLFFPHNELLIIGRDVAEVGIQKYLDFFERDHETRGKVLLAVSETTADDILNITTELEKVPADDIASLIEQYATATSQVKAEKLSDFIYSYMSESSSAVVPMLKVTRSGEKESVEVSGTAVFKSDKMVGKLDKTEGRGLLWVLGEVKSGIIVVEDQEGGLVSAEIIRSKTKMTPVLEDGEIGVRIEITEEGNVGEETGTANLAELNQVTYLENMISEEIKSEVNAALKKARELDTDIFGFASAIKGKYPAQWKNIEDNWEEQFKTMDVEVKVNASLRLMGKISKPLIPEKG